MAHRQSLALLFPAAIVSINLIVFLPSVASAAPVDLAKTGQTTCYSQTGSLVDCTGSGQDGEYQKGIPWPDPRFTNNADGTITDNLTGLTWLADTECVGRVKWLDALVAVNQLANGSCELSDGSAVGDWRMPNYLELISLANLGVPRVDTWYASFGFTNSESYGRGYWSSTSTTQGASSVAGYQFRDRFSGSSSKGGTYQTWPVKGISTGPAKIWRTGQVVCYDDTGTVIDCAGTGQDGDLQMGEPMPVTRFTDNADGTVTDNLTGLTWLRNANCFGPRIWSDALSDANNLADGSCGLSDGSSAGDWRLPNPMEIVSLTDFSRSQPMIPAGNPFTNVPTFNPSLYHWTSSNWLVAPQYTYMGGTTALGYYTNADKANAEFLGVWPVRDGGISQPDPVFENGFEGEDIPD